MPSLPAHPPAARRGRAGRGGRGAAYRAPPAWTPAAKGRRRRGGPPGPIAGMREEAAPPGATALRSLPSHAIPDFGPRGAGAAADFTGAAEDIPACCVENTGLIGQRPASRRTPTAPWGMTPASARVLLWGARIRTPAQKSPAFLTRHSGSPAPARNGAGPGAASIWPPFPACARPSRRRPLGAAGSRRPALAAAGARRSAESPHGIPRPCRGRGPPRAALHGAARMRARRSGRSFRRSGRRIRRADFRQGCRQAAADRDPPRPTGCGHSGRRRSGLRPRRGPDPRRDRPGPDLKSF